MSFTAKKPETLTLNPFTMIGKEWFLLTSGAVSNYNTMTCSWGGLGVLWNQNVVTAYVRTSRHTFDYLEKSNLFTISVFPEQYRKALAYCGSHSGREVDKAKETGLTPISIDGTTAFEEAKLILVCEKVYAQILEEENFILKENLTDFYQKDAMHKMYIGRILNAYEKD